MRCQWIAPYSRSGPASPPCAAYRRITNGCRGECGVTLYARIRSVVETARRRSIRAINRHPPHLDGRPHLPQLKTQTGRPEALCVHARAEHAQRIVRARDRLAQSPAGSGQIKDNQPSLRRRLEPGVAGRKAERVRPNAAALESAPVGRWRTAATTCGSLRYFPPLADAILDRVLHNALSYRPHWREFAHATSLVMKSKCARSSSWPSGAIGGLLTSSLVREDQRRVRSAIFIARRRPGRCKSCFNSKERSFYIFIGRHCS
jgi:hypothetical protein